MWFSLSITQFRYGVKPLVFLGLLWPAAWVIVQWRYAVMGQAHGLGFNPVEYIHHYTGNWAIRFLLLGLAISPLAKLKPLRRGMLLRRMVGLFAAFYVGLHLLGYLWLDLQFNMDDFLQDVLKRNYITVGVLALVMLIPLVMTSFNKAIRWLGARRWQSLHKLVYWIVGLACLHFLMMRKGLQLEPLVHIFIFFALMGFRLKKYFKKSKA